MYIGYWTLNKYYFSHKKLQSLGSNKSPGPYKLHPRILKELAKELTTPLAIIYNKCIDKGTLPSQWKETSHTDLQKGMQVGPQQLQTDVTYFSSVQSHGKNYIRKHNYWNMYCKSNSLQCSQQHGFTTGRSTTTNLLETVNIRSEALSHNVPVDVIFLDYAKTFDTAPHIRLENQIETFGISRNLLAWIKTFLTGRR